MTVGLHPVREGCQNFLHAADMRHMHIMRQVHYASEALPLALRAAENMRIMQDRPKHYLREWRKHRGFKSIDAAIEAAKEILADRVIAEGEEGDLKRIGLSQSNMSRVESGKIPYNQDLLEILAEVYRTDPASLIMRNPLDPQAIWSIMDGVEPAQLDTALKVVEGAVAPFKKAANG